MALRSPSAACKNDVQNIILRQAGSSPLDIQSSDFRSFDSPGQKAFNFVGQVVDEDKVGLVEGEVKVTLYLWLRRSCRRHCVILKEMSGVEMPG